MFECLRQSVTLKLMNLLPTWFSLPPPPLPHTHAHTHQILGTPTDKTWPGITKNTEFISGRYSVFEAEPLGQHAPRYELLWPGYKCRGLGMSGEAEVYISAEVWVWPGYEWGGLGISAEVWVWLHYDIIPPYRLDEDAVDLLEELLRFESKNRIPAREAMRHPYFHSLGPRIHQLPNSEYSFPFQCMVLFPFQCMVLFPFQCMVSFPFHNL